MAARLYFVELSVANPDASLAWYREVLRLEIRFREDGGQFVLLEAGGIGVALKAGQPRPGGVLFTWLVDDLDEWIGHLAACGVALDGPVVASPEGYCRARFRDPDGYAVCLFAWKR